MLLKHVSLWEADAHGEVRGWFRANGSLRCRRHSPGRMSKYLHHMQCSVLNSR